MSHRDRRAQFVQNLTKQEQQVPPVPAEGISVEGRAAALMQAERLADIQTVALEIAQQGIERNRGR